MFIYRAYWLNNRYEEETIGHFDALEKAQNSCIKHKQQNPFEILEITWENNEYGLSNHNYGIEVIEVQ